MLNRNKCPKSVENGNKRIPVSQIASGNILGT